MQPADAGTVRGIDCQIKSDLGGRQPVFDGSKQVFYAFAGLSGRASRRVIGTVLTWLGVWCAAALVLT